MAYKFEVWCDSGANNQSMFKTETDTDEMGYTEEEWDALSDERKELELRDVALCQFEWGFTQLD